ncbi:DUF3048 domain-containing protein [Lacrimispora saccharolytica]|uniref:DUF3048 domain-containing protein n=1 Tax=Lacrimispora saccharolytica (strain ATCC 35040 / DSM 2544 / NRCC 2533 / WM1) TaxID=610130 RepID=D9R199_LACSW|nr:DUF3048 domain-containing protein [Lacrimispora saccharolytica]ADL04646.1 conserved hypothetical protein [[Clostridium] saccharolyticum WM1]QRV21120.1 DUF3048 domain-containing protein [Lacrimispora saccharolytica]
MMKKVWFGFAGFLLSAAFLSGCSKKYEEVWISEQSVVPSDASETKEIKISSTEAANGPEANTGEYYTFEERTEKDGMIRSYLTGEMVDTAIGNRRPVAVMMSNDKEALPQYGINRAGVVYEAPAEGGMNRYMAVLENYDDLDRIGSVRSCRTYYTYFAREFDAIYAHYGQSTFAKPYLANVDNINGLDAIGTVAYFRTKDRKSPHNAYTSGNRLNKAILQLGYSETYDSSYRGHYRFAKDGRKVTLEEKNGVSDAYKVYPGYVLNKPWFEYHEDDGLYYRFQYGAPHKGDEGQIKVKNIILQYCPSAHYATTEYLNINVQDDSYGCYVTEGRSIPIKWSKDGEFGPTHYYDMENNEIILNQGKTWVCIISAQDSPNVKLYGKE